ncbi:MAG TPA: serine hydrolase [Chthonomonadaceae bacterium]|nr:serine hydrolase [Chthonomonadaceae bacterium]
MSDSSTRRNRRAFLSDMALTTAACALSAASSEAAPTASSPVHKLPRTHPETVGISPEAILAFIHAVEQSVGGLHSFMLLRHGQVAAEGWWTPYAPASPHMLFSLSKSFTSTAVGLAIAEGHLHVEDAVTSFFPDSLPSPVSENLAAMQVRHLLSMSTGHDKDATGPTTAQPEGDWVRGFLSLPVEHAPGSKFVYNSAATYMLSAIVQKLTGKTVLDYLTPRLFAPLGIQDATWEKCPRGIDTGGWGLSIKTEDIARFGQLYLQHGQWQGQQLVPQDWVEQATTKHISNGDPAAASDWSQGYCYQFWRCRHEAYRGDGAFGQYCVVMPQQDAVLAITSGVADMQAVLNAVWDHLLPGIQSAPLTSSQASKELPHTIQKLALPHPTGQTTSPTAAKVSGKAFRFEPNSQQVESLTLTFEGDHCHLTLHDNKGEHTLECTPNTWVKGTSVLEGTPSTKVAVRGIWTQEDTYTATLCFYETPFIQTLTCTFAPDQVTLTRKRNVGFGPTEAPPLVGRLA